MVEDWRLHKQQPAPNNMTKEEKRQREKERYHDWYWNRGGREKRHVRLREVGPYKWGTAREIPSKVY